MDNSTNQQYQVEGFINPFFDERFGSEAEPVNLGSLPYPHLDNQDYVDFHSQAYDVIELANQYLSNSESNRSIHFGIKVQDINHNYNVGLMSFKIVNDQEGMKIIVDTDKCKLFNVEDNFHSEALEGLSGGVIYYVLKNIVTSVKGIWDMKTLEDSLKSSNLSGLAEDLVAFLKSLQ